MKKILYTIFLLMISVTLLSADYYIKQKSHSDEVSIMGQTQPATDEEIEIWITEDLKKFVSHSPSQSVIIILENNTMTMVNHQKKTYVEMELPLDLSKYFPDEMSKMVESMMDSVTINVSPTGEEKTIGEWNCAGYEINMNVMMMKINMKIWATTEVPFNWGKVSEDMMTRFFQAQLRLSEKAVEEFQKVKGYWIATETNTTVMGNTFKATTEVVEMDEKETPAAAFQIPEGYTKQEKFSREDMQRR